MLRGDGIKKNGWREGETRLWGAERPKEGNKNNPCWLRLGERRGKKKSYDRKQQMSERGGGGDLI